MEVYVDVICVYGLHPPIIVSTNIAVFMEVHVDIDIIPLQPDIRYYFYLPPINNINMPA
jgi:hypothetical protein